MQCNAKSHFDKKLDLITLWNRWWYHLAHGSFTHRVCAV